MKNRIFHSNTLSHYGISPTKHRQLVFDIFSNLIQPLTAKDILEKVRQKQSMDKVTLYRILDLFVAKKIIRRIATVQGTNAYKLICDHNREQHPHFICRECGDIECLEEVRVKDINLNFLPKTKINRDDLEVNLEGVCPKCQI